MQECIYPDKIEKDILWRFVKKEGQWLIYEVPKDFQEFFLKTGKGAKDYLLNQTKILPDIPANLEISI